MKTRAFVRYSKKGKIVPGSLILTAGSYPQGSSTWKEVPADLCCLQPQDYSSCMALQGIPDELLNYGFSLQTDGSGPNMTGTIHWAPGVQEQFTLPSDGSTYDFVYTFEDAAPRTVYLCINNPFQLSDFELGFGPGNTVSVNNAYKLNGLEEWDSDSMSILSLDLSGLTSLQFLFHRNTILSYINITGCANLIDIDLADNTLVEASVNHVLITLDSSGLSNGFVDLSGGTSSGPTGLGALAAASLIVKGWTVNTN